MAEKQAQKMYTLELPAEEVNLILKGLGKLLAEESIGMILKVKNVCAAQDKAEWNNLKNAPAPDDTPADKKKKKEKKKKEKKAPLKVVK